MSSIFTKIAKGELPAYKVAETGDYFAFLDINPLKKGHTLVVPKKEVDYLFDLDKKTYQGLWNFAHQVAKALDKAISCERVAVAVLGMEVPHAHIHLVPIDNEGDLNFANERVQLSKGEFVSVAKTIYKAYNSL